MSQFAAQRVLVTGGAGFIGSNLTDRLLAEGAFVRVLDNFSTGYRKNLAEAQKSERFELVEGDIRDRAVCDAAMEGIDYVLHQAALGSVPRSIKDPATTVGVNVFGFTNVLHSAVEHKVKRFVFASSSSVYGDEKTLPKVEERTGTALSPYAISKQSNETIALNFGTLYGIEVIGLRYFNVFGQRQDPDGAYAAVIPKFIGRMLSHEAPVINGDGSYSRDFTYIDNVVEANCLALLAGREACFKMYNVSCGSELDLKSLYGILREELSKYDPAVAELEAVYGECRAGDIPHSLGSIARAEKYLGYRVKVQVAEGLQRTCKWFYSKC
ncbi:MAG: SDR family oxidoreductase [Lentisphaeria bacterium]|nr:SDR family oxidoreductase [Lentisphaeria bacterium]MBR7118910.1 SDR family oxidoreductase [Lentisphaeria bacterium]